MGGYRLQCTEWKHVVPTVCGQHLAHGGGGPKHTRNNLSSCKFSSLVVLPFWEVCSWTGSALDYLWLSNTRGSNTTIPRTISTSVIIPASTPNWKGMPGRPSFGKETGVRLLIVPCFVNDKRTFVLTALLRWFSWAQIAPKELPGRPWRYG